MAHGLQCLRDGRACCPSLPKQLVICRFLRFQRRPSRCCFKSLLHWTGPGWIEFPTEWNLCKRVRARSGGAWTCLAHGLQCWRVRGACCPSLLKQLVIWVVVEVSTVTVMCCYNSMCTGMYRVGTNVPLKTNRANKYAHVPMCHEHACRTVCSVGAYGARVVHHFLSNS